MNTSVFFFFLGPHLRQMEVPRLGVESELQLLAYATATATPDLSFIWDLHCSLQQHQSLTHRARPGIEPVSSWTLCWILNLLSHSENSHGFLRKVVSYLYNLHTSQHVCGQNGHGDAAIGKNLPYPCVYVCVHERESERERVHSKSWHIYYYSNVTQSLLYNQNHHCGYLIKLPVATPVLAYRLKGDCQRGAMS